MFEFTDDCLLGVEEIDDEHRHLFDLLNEAVYMLENEYIEDRYSEIKDLLEELDEYADQHFTHEEEYMEGLRDPELILQRSQHAFFREKILEFTMKNIDDLDEQHEALAELINFLAKWLYQHIIASDILIGKLPPLEEWMIKEDPCEFTDEYKVGIDKIDKEHKNLFELIGHANRLVRNWGDGDRYDEIMDILGELKEYTKTHFAHEEEYMLAVRYKDYDAQKRAHEAFIAKLDHLNEEEIKKDPLTYLQSLVQFLLGWLINHILHADKKIGEAL